MKNSTELRKDWIETKEKLKLKFKKLTDDDLFFTEGKQAEIIDKLQVKYHLSKEEINKIIANL